MNIHLRYLSTRLFFILLLVFSINASFAFQTGNVLSLKIGQGVSYTVDKEVTLHIKLIKHDIKHIDQMKVGFKRDLSDVEWEHFHHQKELLLTKGDGVYAIYVRVSDKAGNSSPIESIKIKLDTRAPEVKSFTINGESKYSKNVLGNVSLQFDVDDAFEMQIKNEDKFHLQEDWIPYKAQKGWTFAKGDGEKHVYVRFRDKAKNVSEVVSASIIVDATPPTGRVQINQDERVTNTRETYLSIWASEDTRDMRLTDGTRSEQLKYEPGQRDAPMFHHWVFDSLDGKKIIRIFFRDLAGNLSNQPASDFILLDTEPPTTPRMTLNKGAKYSINKEGKVRVFLALPPKELTEGYKMIVSNSASLDESKKIDFSKIIVWDLESASDGSKKVYAKLFDDTGNASEVVSDEIILDRQAPEAKMLVINAGTDHTSEKKVSIELKAIDATEMIVSNDSEFKGGAIWEPYKEIKNDWFLIKNGKNSIYAKFKDEAGNQSEVVSDDIIFDNAAPTASITINNRSTVTNNRDVILYLEHEKDANEMILSNKPDFTGAKWEPARGKVEWRLTEKDGQKAVGVKFRDKAGNTSKPILGKIILDTRPPLNCEISLNDGKKYNQQTKVRVNSKAIGAVQMMFSENDDFADGKWQPFKPFIEVYLSVGDGEKKLYAKFRDAIGNESESVSDDIIIDSKHPVADNFLINGGAEYVNHPQKKVVLTFKAADANRLKISTDSQFRGAEWERYTEGPREFILPGEDGEKTLYVIFADVAGNLSSPKRATIILDRKL